MKTLVNTVKGKAYKLKAQVKTFLNDNSGMELLQVLVIIIIAVVLGGLLIAWAAPSFTTNLGTVDKKITSLFS